MVRDRVFAIVVLLFTSVMLWETMSVPGPTSWQPYGSNFFPRIVLVILGVLSLALLVRSFVVRLPVATPTDEPGLDAAAFWQRYRRTFFLFAGFGLYAWLLPRLGFIIASLLFVGSMQALLLGRVRPRQALMIGLLTVGVTLALYATFTYGLRVRLP
jgi:putative tricarboxylic transport membrane protein